ncbi:hypothetical protein FKP32DRAFT_20367 [Trametes sanguinea]|nr:hypothetical protein FKP32DRAFT_20367 [Trametes sanguinea]
MLPRRCRSAPPVTPRTSSPDELDSRPIGGDAPAAHRVHLLQPNSSIRIARAPRTALLSFNKHSRPRRSRSTSRADPERKSHGDVVGRPRADVRKEASRQLRLDQRSTPIVDQSGNPRRPHKHPTQAGLLQPSALAGMRPVSGPSNKAQLDRTARLEEHSQKSDMRPAKVPQEAF